MWHLRLLPLLALREEVQEEGRAEGTRGKVRQQVTGIGNSTEIQMWSLLCLLK